VLEAFLDWLAALPTFPSYLVLMALSAVENIFPPVPADVAVALGAFLSQRGEISAPLIGISCWLANTASSAGVYFLARWRGREFFESGWRRRLMPPEAMGAISGAYARHGMLGIFLSRFLPGVRAAVTPFAGVVGMPPLRALLPAATASGLWYAAIVLAGATLSRNWQTVRSAVDNANRALGLVSLGAGGAFAWWLWTKLRRTR
jgi:membrane protein DedA with SNARE-associated domain